MKIYILILMAFPYYESGGMMSAEFESKEKCEKALRWSQNLFIRKNNGQSYVKGKCFEK